MYSLRLMWYRFAAAVTCSSWLSGIFMVTVTMRSSRFGSMWRP